MVVWSGFLDAAALGMGTTSTQAGLILSLIFTIAIIIVVAIATGGQAAQVTMPLSGVLGMILFLALGWMPQVLGTILALVSALFVVQVIMKNG